MKDPKDKKLELGRYIGMKVKKARRNGGLKLVDVARISGISQGMVSKIENAQVSTSLETLDRLCSAIGLSISQLFSDYDRPDGDAHFTKSNQGLEVVQRGTEKGQIYQLLSYKHATIEPFIITLTDTSETTTTFSHSGDEFIYLISGKLVYRHGNSLFEMEPGDSLTFNGEIPHGPESLVETPIKLLSVFSAQEDS